MVVGMDVMTSPCNRYRVHLWTPMLSLPSDHVTYRAPPQTLTRRVSGALGGSLSGPVTDGGEVGTGAMMGHIGRDQRMGEVPWGASGGGNVTSARATAAPAVPAPNSTTPATA